MTKAWVLRASCLAVSLFVGFIGCGRVSNETGGETNWLTCDVDEDCPSGVMCEAGHCGPPPGGLSGGGSGGSSAGSSSQGPIAGMAGWDTLPCDINELMQRSCWGIGCHGNEPGTIAADLDLMSAGVEARLLNVPASHMHILDGSDVNCAAGELRIDGNNPEESLILKKILGRQSCGSNMPVAPRVISANDALCIRSWVYTIAGQEVPPGPWPPPEGSGGTSGSGGTAHTAGTGGFGGG